MDKKILLMIIAAFFWVANIYAVDNEIDADALRSIRYETSPEKAFALNGKVMQIKTPATVLDTAWAGHNIMPGENSVVFKAKASGGKNVRFNIRISMSAYHADPGERCNGRSKTKYFIFGDYVQNSWKDFCFRFSINAAELSCRQCGKLVNHATFLFAFSTEKTGGIEFTPFTLKTDFNITLQKKKDAHSPYISNLLSPGYKPYEMKKLPAQSLLADDVLTLSQKANSTQKQYADFRVVMELLQKKDNKNAIIQAEKIAAENVFSAVMLYLVYSRGYCGEKIDYLKAAKYFNQLIGSYIGKEPGYMFWVYEYKNIWKKYRLPPNNPGETVMLKAWDARGRVMDEIVPLRGKIPLKNCYEESMRNIGGVGARAVYLITREQYALFNILQDARKLGNAEAWAGDHAPFESRSLQPERTPLADEGFNKPAADEYANLKRAAELGYIPAKLYIARALAIKNFTSQNLDLATARKLLKESIAECEKYSAAGCVHVQTDLKYARDLLAVIPEENTPAQKLIKLYDQLQADVANGRNIAFLRFRMNILAEMISKNGDHPDALYLQALKLPSAQYKQKNKMIRAAAEKGSLKAVKMCLDSVVPRNDKEYWYFLYLAGKHKLPYNGWRQNYFNEAFMLLQEMRFQMPPPDYKKALSFLAPYHKSAQNEYSKLSKELNFDIALSDKATVSAVKINNGGRHCIEIKAAPSKEKRYVIIKNKSAEKIRGALFFYSVSRECGNLYISGEFLDENGKLQKTYPGNSVPMKYLPRELKVLIAPRSEPLDLQIRFMLY